MRHNTSATARLIFDYMMLNYSRKLNHTHKIPNADLAIWLECSEVTIRRELAHLKKIGAIQKHPDKISVYHIPALHDLRDELHAYRLARKEEALQKRIAEVEFDLDRPLNEREKVRVEKDMRRDEAYKERQKKKRAQTTADFGLDLPFGDDEV